MSHTPRIHSTYLQHILTPAQIKRLVKAAVPLLNAYDFQAIAFRGMSGALIAPLLAYRTNKTLIMVRKPKLHADEDHSYLRVEGDSAIQRYVIVDDFMCSGATVRAIITDISLFAPRAKCLGAMFYSDFFNSGANLRISANLRCVELKDFIVNDPVDFIKPRIQKVLTAVI